MKSAQTDQANYPLSMISQL